MQALEQQRHARTSTRGAAQGDGLRDPLGADSILGSGMGRDVDAPVTPTTAAVDPSARTTPVADRYGKTNCVAYRRTAPGFRAGRTLDAYPPGKLLKITSETTVDNPSYPLWYGIDVDGDSAFMAAKLVDGVDRTSALYDREDSDQQARASGGVTLARAEPSADASVRFPVLPWPKVDVTQILRPKRPGAAGWAKITWMGREGYAPLSGLILTARPLGEAEEKRRERVAQAQAGLVADPETGWGQTIGDAHGVEVHRNNVDTSKLPKVKEKFPDLWHDGTLYSPCLTGTYGLQYQCVEFVNRYYAVRLGQPNMIGTGNAKNYISNNGHLDTHLLPGPTRPQPGDLMVKTGGTFGHVGIVKSAPDSGDSGSVVVASQNAAGNSPYASYALSKSDGKFNLSGAYWAGFRRVKGQTPPQEAPKTEERRDTETPVSAWEGRTNCVAWMRSAAGFESGSKLHTWPQGTTVQVVAETRVEHPDYPLWYRVKVGGETGFVAAKLIDRA